MTPQQRLESFNRACREMDVLARDFGRALGDASLGEQKFLIHILYLAGSQQPARLWQELTRSLARGGQLVGLPQAPALSRELLETAKRARFLEITTPLPGGWECSSPEEFLGRLQEEPRALRELLLAQLPSEETPQESLLMHLYGLASNLRAWREDPCLALEDEALRALGARVFKATHRWSQLLSVATLGRLHSGFLRLLRWRLERAEDPLALLESWGKHIWGVAAPALVEQSLKIVVGAADALLGEEGSSLSTGSWDAVVTYIFRLAAEADGAAARQGELLLRAWLEALAPLAQPESGLVDALASLEAEGFAGLPPEMREVFLKRACVGYSPALGALL